MLHEKVAMQNEAKKMHRFKKQREEDERIANLPPSPKSQVNQMMKHLRFRAAEYAENKKMDVQERMALQDYVDKKLRSF